MLQVTKDLEGLITRLTAKRGQGSDGHSDGDLLLAESTASLDSPAASTAGVVSPPIPTRTTTGPPASPERAASPPLPPPCGYARLGGATTGPCPGEDRNSASEERSAERRPNNLTSNNSSTEVLPFETPGQPPPPPPPSPPLPQNIGEPARGDADTQVLRSTVVTPVVPFSAPPSSSTPRAIAAAVLERRARVGGSKGPGAANPAPELVVGDERHLLSRRVEPKLEKHDGEEAPEAERHTARAVGAGGTDGGRGGGRRRQQDSGRAFVNSVSSEVRRYFVV